MRLIVFSGLPGTGKSVLAEAIVWELGISVFAKDWIDATQSFEGNIELVFEYLHNQGE